MVLQFVQGVEVGHHLLRVVAGGGRQSAYQFYLQRLSILLANARMNLRLFTLCFYSHSPDQYDKLRDKKRSELIKYWRYDTIHKDWYLRNKDRLERQNILPCLEEDYPTPILWNDIAGFLSVSIENAAEGFRVVCQVWSIKNRKFRSKKVFSSQTSETRLIEKRLFNEPIKFNQKFFELVAGCLDRIKKDFIRKKGFYFDLDLNLLSWPLIQTSDVAGMLKQQGWEFR